jgi:MFS family permease
MTHSIDPTDEAIGEGRAVGEEPDPRRWWALSVLAVAQLMIVLDASIVNIALPSAQADLGITDANRQWIVTAYTLAFGGLLLLGGRIADYNGRKRTFIVGLLGFATASAIGGLAPNQELLFAARGCPDRVRIVALVSGGQCAGRAAHGCRCSPARAREQGAR